MAAPPSLAVARMTGIGRCIADLLSCRTNHSQQGWFVYPQSTQLSLMHVFGNPQGYGNADGSVQQTWDVSPHAMHIPPEHVVPAAQTFEPQQACPSPPHPRARPRTP